MDCCCPFSPHSQQCGVLCTAGGNTGIGFETAKALSSQGYLTVLACRDNEQRQGSPGPDQVRTRATCMLLLELARSQ